MLRTRTRLAAVAIAFLLLAALPLVGPELLSPSLYWSGDTASLDMRILWEIRVPRTLVACIAGAGLALGGMAFQALFHNPLATPFTLGVSSGAALGAALAIRLGLTFSIAGISPVTVTAFLGAVLSIGLVGALTWRRRAVDAATILLAGVAVAYSFSSLTLFVQYTSDLEHSFRIVRWLLGGFSGVVGYDDVARTLPFVAAGAAIIFGLRTELDLIVNGDEIAASRGVDIQRTRALIVLGTTLMVAAIVAVCGPIGFVGLLGPHIARRLAGSDHRTLFFSSALVGGVLLGLCDAASRTLVAPAELPAGVLTALVGGPFFLWILLRRAS